MTPFRFRPFWGMAVGALFAVVLMIYFVVREQLLGDVALERQGESLEQVVAMYLLGGIVGGLVLGVLLPWTKRPVGAMLVGMVTVMPFFVIQALVEGAWRGGGGQNAVSWWTVIVGSALVGGLAGYLIRTRLFGELEP